MVLSRANNNNKIINILVVDDDSTCLAVAAAVLRKGQYQVVTAKHPKDALITLRINGGFDLVVSDVHMPEMNGFQLQQLITTEFDLPVVLMSADDKVNLVKNGIATDNALFISKPVTINDVRDLWRIAASKRCMLEELPAQDSGSDGGSVVQAAEDEPKACSMGSPDNNNKKSERKCRKKKLKWTSSLHNKFLEAIRRIGLDNAVPKRILEAMDVEGITRENIASHLQKYRIFLRRVSENVDYSPRPRMAPNRRLSKFFLFDERHSHAAGHDQPSFGRNIFRVEQPPSAAMPHLGGFSSSSTTGFGYGQSDLLSRVVQPCHNNNNNNNLGGHSLPITSNNMGNPLIYQPNFTAPSLPPPLVFNGNEAPITTQTFAAANYNNDRAMTGASTAAWPNNDRMMIMMNGPVNNNVVVPEPFDHHHNDDMNLIDDDVRNLLMSDETVENHGGYVSTGAGRGNSYNSSNNNNPSSTVTTENPFSPTMFFVDTMAPPHMDELQTLTPPPPPVININNVIITTGGGGENMMNYDSMVDRFLAAHPQDGYGGGWPITDDLITSNNQNVITNSNFSSNADYVNGENNNLLHDQFLMQRDDEMFVESMLASIPYDGDENLQNNNIDRN